MITALFIIFVVFPITLTTCITASFLCVVRFMEREQKRKELEK